MDADFGLAFGGGSEVNNADELFFKSVGVATENFLTGFDAHRHEDQGAVGANVQSKRVFGDVLAIGPTANNEDGETEEDALAAAAVGDGSGI